MNRFYRLTQCVTVLLVTCCAFSLDAKAADKKAKKNAQKYAKQHRTEKNHKIKHDVKICGDAKICGDEKICGDLTVAGQARIDNNLIVGQNLAAGNNATVGKDLTVGHNLKVLNDFSVSGNTTLHDVTAQAVTAQAVTAQTVTAESVVAESVAAKDVSGCLVRSQFSVLGEERTVFRDQFRRDELLGMMQKLVQEYLAESEAWITIPDYGWQGVAPISSLEDMPKKTFQVSSLDDNKFLEEFVMLTSIMYYELEEIGRVYNLSTDIKNTTFENSGKAAYTQAIVDLSQYLLGKIDTLVLQPDDIHRIALKICNSYFQTLTNFYGNPLYRFSSNWSQLYSACKHKFYNEILHADFISYGELDQLWWDWNYYFQGIFPLELTLLKPENLKTLPQAWMSDYRSVQQLLDNETQGKGKYFWPRFIADAKNSKAYVQNIDVEGYIRSPEFSLEIYDIPGTTLYLSPLEDMKKPFKELSINYPIGGVAFTYPDNDQEGIFGFETYVKAGLSEEDAAKVLCESETIYNTLMRPLFEQILAVVKERQAESHDDDYPGAWRAKIQTVKQVIRDNDGFSQAFVTPFSDSVDVEVPMDPQDNATYAASQGANVDPDPQTGEELLLAFFEQKQADIQEMDTWLLNMLENTLDVHTGNLFPLLRKVNANKNIVNGSPYATIEEILQNFVADEKTVGIDGELPDLVYQSGISTTEFLYDVKEFLANLWVVQEHARFGFASANPGDILLFTANDDNVIVTYQMAVDDVNVSARNALSDVEALGRHYGYNADGSIKADEWSGDELVYTYSALDTSNQLKTFDFIYRQHYAYDKDAALIPTNIVDPQTGKTYYQFTDAGDEERRAVLTAEYSALETLTLGQTFAGKQGSYNRWKTDWVFQKIAGFVINTAGPKGLLPQDFVQEYFVDHFVDTNNPPAILPDIQVIFRAKGNLGANVFSQSITDTQENIFTVVITMETFNPKANTSIQNRLGLMLHEGALGHGFDGVPNAVDYLNGVIPELSWLTSGFFPNAESPIETWSYPLLRPGLVTLFEGWATFGELMGLTYGYYVFFDENGEPIPGTFDVLSSLNEIIDLSRISSRQIVAIAENFSKYAWTLNKCVNTFTETSNITVAGSANYHSRFVGHPMQQTGYASGLVTNLGLVSIISQELANQGKCFDFGKYVQFRIQRTDYILGATLVEVALENLDFFEAPCPPLAAVEDATRKSRTVKSMTVKHDAAKAALAKPNRAVPTTVKPANLVRQQPPHKRAV